MSITFFCPDAPTETCSPFPDEPEYTTTRPVAPFIEINMSNSNAFDLQALIDPAVTPDYCGTWPQDKLQGIQRRLMILLNTDKKAAFLLESSTSKEEGQCTFHYCGRSNAYVTQRLAEFLSLVTVALQHKAEICFG